MSERAYRRIELVLTLLGMFSAFLVWSDSRWAHSDVVDARFSGENQKYMELKGEVDALYLHMIPEPERTPLRYPAGGGR